MKRLFKLMVLAATIITLASCSAARQVTADKGTLTWSYEIEPTTGQATQGSILVKVWSYSKDKNIATTQAGKNAVHGVLFKGVAALNNEYARVPAQRPIVTDPTAETTYQEYFKDFFQNGGKYMKYVNFVNNGIPAPGDIIKVGKQYKVGVRVSVSKDALRKEMEAAGVVKALGAGF
jgi:hypothetical protein